MTEVPNGDHSEAGYEVYALRYATWHERLASRHFYRYELYGRDDHVRQLDFFFWLLRRKDHVVLVDCGYDRERAGSRRGRYLDNDPLEMLNRFDIGAEDVDHVVVSHMHFDHVGNIGLFPNATVSVARKELEYFTGPYSDRPAINYPTEPEEIQTVIDYAGDGRVQFIDDAAELFPGISVTRVGGHTPGSMITHVDTGQGEVILAADAVHYYEELEEDHAFHLHSDLREMFAAYDLLRDFDARPDTTVVAGHDPLVMGRFEAVGTDCLDLGKPKM